MLCREELCYLVWLSRGSAPEADFREPASLDLSRESARYQACSAFRALAQQFRAWERLCPV
jgi:hypothetical protein